MNTIVQNQGLAPLNSGVRNNSLPFNNNSGLSAPNQFNNEVEPLRISRILLPRITHDAKIFSYSEDYIQPPVNVNINDEIDFYNQRVDSGLEQLDLIEKVVRQRIFMIKGTPGKVKDSGYAAGTIIIKYTSFLKVLQEAKTLIQQQESDYERRMFELATSQIRSVQIQLTREEEQERLESEEDRRMYEDELAQIEAAALTHIDVEVYVGSGGDQTGGTIGYPAILLSSDNSDLVHDNRISMRNSFRIPTRTLAPFFNLIPFIRDRLITLNGPSQEPNGDIELGLAESNQIKALLRNILGVDNWSSNNSWFLFIVPAHISINAYHPDTAQPSVRGVPLSAYNDEQLMDYEVFGSCKFPYVHFINPTPILHDNCIVNILMHKYHLQPSSKNALAKSTISKWFNNGTSIRNIIGFFKKYKISYQIFDIAGKRLLKNPREMLVDTKSRSAIALMLFNNHACMYDIPLNEKLDLSLTSDHTIKDWHSTHTFKKEEMPPDILVPGLKLLDTPPNYTHECEKEVCVRSVTYEDHMERGRTVGYDQNKSFYNNFMKCDPNMKIGIFSVLDEFVAYNGEEIISYAKYLLDDEIQHLVLGQQNNVMFGFRLAFLISQGSLNKSHIKSVKIPTYTTRCIHLQTMLKDKRNEFSIYYGILGKITTKSSFISMTMIQRDLQFLLHHHPDITHRAINPSLGWTPPPKEGQVVPPIEYYVDIPMRKAKHIELNNRNYYEFIVEMTNHSMEVAMFKVLDTNPHVRVTKLWVDLIAFNEAIEDSCLGKIGKDADCEFKFEETFNAARPTNFTYHDPDVVSDAIRQEIILFKENCKVTTGMPGTGKTTKIKSEGGYEYASSFTNVASLLVSGKTLHMTFFLQDLSQFYKLAKKFRGKTVWIDEISQMPSWIWSCIFTLFKRCNTKFILSGDRDQLRPYKENPNYNGMFFTELFRDATVLTENHRCTRELVEMSQRILHDSSFSFSDFKTEESFPKGNSYSSERPLGRVEFDHLINYHFTLTKNLRDVINAEIMKRRGLTFDPPTAGLRVVANKSIKELGLVKGSIYEVINYSTVNHNGIAYDLAYIDNKMKLKGIFPTTEVIDIKKSQYLKYFNVGYARTIDSCIGLTIEEPVAVYEIAKIKYFPFWQNRIYTAVTRVRKVEHLNIYNGYPMGFEVNRSLREQEYEDAPLPRYVALRPTCLPFNTLLTVIS